MRLRAPASATVLALLVSLAACGGSGGPADRPGPAQVDGPEVREPVTPQVIGPDTKLVSCSNGAGGTAARDATVLVPIDFTEFTGFTADEEYREDNGPEAGSVVCFFGLTGPMEFRRPRRSAFAITVPAQQALRAAVERFALRRGPRPVVERAAVLGSPDGERATYRAREAGTGRPYDAVAVQAGGIRLTWVGPTAPSPDGGARDRQVWQQVQDSLAVRAPAAADGDADAESDPDPPDQPTTVLTDVEPAGATRQPGYRRVRCDGEDATVSFLLPDRIPDAGRCSWNRPLPAPWNGEGVHVTIGPRSPLRSLYEVARALEADGGDAGTSGLEYDNDVPGPGDLRTESFVYTTANDGAPLERHILQAGGVRLRWTVTPGTWGPQGDELSVVLASLAVTTR